ncbi:MAG: hypothetical protein B5M53_03530 [Candidatus Cloacimonas sp. 4484_209]|nr:MAG: hypothetical protein B5M53_03530 [Candidatus Cloacimonas sp. 4484_209]
MKKVSRDIYVPNVKYIPKIEEVISWFQNVPMEIEECFFPKRLKKKFLSYYKEAGLLKSWKRNYFFRHFAINFSIAVEFLFEKRKAKGIKILDLGCGTGTQSLLFALLGANIVGIDLDVEALEILMIRKMFYEKLSGRSLSIKIYNANALEFPYETERPFDGIYSLFAFNMMQPSGYLISKISRAVSEDARLAIQDGNRLSWVGRFLRKRKQRLSPCELYRELGKNGWEVENQRGCISIPFIFWKLIPNQLLQPIDATLSSSWFFAFSHLTLACFKRNCPDGLEV